MDQDLSQVSTEDLLAQHYGGMDKVPTDILIRIHSEAQKPQANGPSGYAADSGNPSPTSPIAKQLIQGLRDEAPTLGTMMGATAGAAGGPATAIAGAGIGAAGGKAYQRISDYMTGRRDPASDSALGNAGDIAKSGLGGIGAEVAGQQVGSVLKALRPGAARLGAGAMKIAAGIPEKYGEAVLNKPSILSEAKSPEEMGTAYEAFQSKAGLDGLQQKLVAGNRATAPSSELENLVLSAANKVVNGQSVDPQELYLASQAASRLKLAARYGEPQAQMAAASGSISQGKQIVDDALAKIHPEYTGLRTDNFESKARAAFGSVLPKNKGGTTNILRPVMAANEAIGALALGHPGAVAALPAMSPAAWGLGIKGASLATPLAKFLAKYGAAKVANEISE